MIPAVPRRLPDIIRLGTAAAVGIGVFVAFLLYVGGPTLAWDAVKNGLNWPGWIEGLLAFIAYSLWLVLALVLGLAAGIALFALLGQEVKRLAALFVAVSIFALMAIPVMDAAPWDAEKAENAGDADTSASEDGITALVDSLFDKHVIGLEVLGVLLTAAMIGALVIARPLGRPGAETEEPEESPLETDSTGGAGMAGWIAPGAVGTTTEEEE